MIGKKISKKAIPLERLTLDPLQLMTEGARSGAGAGSRRSSRHRRGHAV